MSTRRSLEALCGALLLAWASAGVAADRAPDSAAAERTRIARERAAVEARARAGEAACAREFVVSSCLQQVRAERRAAVQQLERQRSVLDEAQRKQRAAERMARIRERQEAATRDQTKPKVEVRTRGESAPAPVRAAEEVAAIEAGQAQRAQHAAAAASTADAKAVQRAQATSERARKAQAHKESVEERNRDRAAKKAPAAPLPVPSSPASAAR
jgi:colicin import membrane protein